MPHRIITEDAIELPEHLLEVIAKMPAKIDRWEGAEVVTLHIFPTTKRTVESWPLPWEYPNGRAIAPPASYLVYAYRKSCEAPKALGGRRRAIPLAA
jgi:hypothetical protein